MFYSSMVNLFCVRIHYLVGQVPVPLQSVLADSISYNVLYNLFLLTKKLSSFSLATKSQTGAFQIVAQAVLSL